MSYIRYFFPVLAVRSLGLKSSECTEMVSVERYCNTVCLDLFTILCKVMSNYCTVPLYYVLDQKESIINTHIHIKAVETFPWPLRELMGDGEFTSKPLHWSP